MKKIILKKEKKILNTNLFLKKKDEKFVMISNIGSTSRKYVLYKVYKKKFEEFYKINFDGKENYPEVKLDDAILKFFEISKKEYGVSVSDIDVILERVVAVGEYFLEHREIDEEYLERLEEAQKYDSIHTVDLIKEIKKILILRDACKNRNQKCDFKLFGISDSAFHSTIKEEVYTYPIKDFKPEHNFRKYGYHGISMSEVRRETKNFKNVMAIHLGGGGSITAIQNQKSIFNSFGMTPVSGLVNASRVGDVDPFVVLHIFQKNKKSVSFLEGEKDAFKKTEKELFEESGLFALTGKKDFRDILEGLKAKDKKTQDKFKFALQVYLNRINEYVGMSLAHLNGKVDALIWTGNILEKSVIFKEMLFEKISWLPVKQENIFIAKTEEEKEMVNIAIENDFV